MRICQTCAPVENSGVTRLVVNALKSSERGLARYQKRKIEKIAGKRAFLIHTLVACNS